MADAKLTIGLVSESESWWIEAMAVLAPIKETLNVLCVTPAEVACVELQALIIDGNASVDQIPCCPSLTTPSPRYQSAMILQMIHDLHQSETPKTAPSTSIPALICVSTQPTTAHHLIQLISEISTPPITVIDASLQLRTRFLLEDLSGTTPEQGDAAIRKPFEVIEMLQLETESDPYASYRDLFTHIFSFPHTLVIDTDIWKPTLLEDLIGTVPILQMIIEDLIAQGITLAFAETADVWGIFSAVRGATNWLVAFPKIEHIYLALLKDNSTALTKRQASSLLASLLDRSLMDNRISIHFVDSQNETNKFRRQIARSLNNTKLKPPKLEPQPFIPLYENRAPII